MLTLERFCYSIKGTFGKLTLPDHRTIFTVERPWDQNAVGSSCIPEGEYPLRWRRSGVIERTTDGEYLHGWEVGSVPGRSYIMVHIANTMHDVEGCIGPGEALGALGQRWAVLNSTEAFYRLMGALQGREEWRIRVTHYVAGLDGLT